MSGKIISIANQKGGVGKTTTTSSLGSILASKGFKVVLLDLDDQNDLTLALPVDLVDQLLYYVGPSPAQSGQVIGAAGPTTSYRMDKYTPRLLELGLSGTMGKGSRSSEVREAMVKHGAVYLAAFGGAGALLSKSIKEAEVVAFDDAGPEALFRFRVEQFPAVVINDSLGNDFYEMIRNKKKQSHLI